MTISLNPYFDEPEQTMTATTEQKSESLAIAERIKEAHGVDPSAMPTIPQQTSGKSGPQLGEPYLKNNELTYGKQAS